MTNPPQQKKVETKPARVIPKVPVTETEVSLKSDLCKKPADPTCSEHGQGVETTKTLTPKTKAEDLKVLHEQPLIKQLHSNMALSA